MMKRKDKQEPREKLGAQEEGAMPVIGEEWDQKLTKGSGMHIFEDPIK